METIRLPILPLRDPTLVLFPDVSSEIDVGRDFSIEAIKVAQEEKSSIIVAMQRDDSIDVPSGKDFYSICTVAEISKIFSLDDELKQKVIVVGKKRAILKKIIRQKDNQSYICGEIQFPEEKEGKISEDILIVFNNLYDLVNDKLKTIILRKKEKFKTLTKLSSYIDHIAYQLPIDGKIRLELLNELNVEKRLRRILVIAVDLTKSKEFHIEIESRKENDFDIANDELKRIYKMIQDSNMPEDAMNIAMQEFNRLRSMPPSMSEFQVIMNYIETLSSMPWNKKTEDKINIEEAKESLDEDHYGLDKPKERILEYLAVRKMAPEKKGDILCFYGPPGTGKAQPLDAEVLTPDGFKKMGDIKVGDIIVTPSGDNSYVSAVFPQGEKDIFKIKFSDNNYTECCKEHLWSVMDRDDRLNNNTKYNVLSTEYIRKNLLVGNGRTLNYSIPFVNKIDINCNIKRTIDPYLLGFLLSSKYFNKFSFSDLDEDVIENITSKIKKFKVLGPNKYSYNTQDSINSSLLNVYLKMMDLKNGSYIKAIPIQYKIAPFNIRLSILQGLLDNRGYIKDNNIEFYSFSKQLSLDVKFIVESLGGRANYYDRIENELCKYYINISLPSYINPFYCKRKSDIYSESRAFFPRYIKEISYIGKKEAQCILVDHPEHQYITNNFIVTHNTSCGKSIAKAMGRKFIRLSLGGVHDEAEIRGHRRTYVGAMLGKVMQQIKKVGVNNPVFMLDEVDKLSRDYRGDPASALLEVLDPEQNNSFVDNYLNVPFDLSDVLFISTVNELTPISPALRDRMDIVELNGYSPNDKVKIAEKHLIPKQKISNGLKEYEISISSNTINKIIEEYTSEAGVRSLERKCKDIFRKIAVMVSSKKKIPKVIKDDFLVDLIGPPKIFVEKAASRPEVGLSTGLAYTKGGGSILFVESLLIAGDGKVKLTGNLGNVLKESVTTSYTWIKSNANILGVDLDKMKFSDIHIHFPEGATPKDGPSAGIAITASILSTLLNKPIRNDIAMTGEISLRGRVLPIGGLVEKSLAAERAGIKKIICPSKNKYDIDEIPKDVKDNIEFILVDNLFYALKLLILDIKDNVNIKEDNAVSIKSCQ